MPAAIIPIAGAVIGGVVSAVGSSKAAHAQADGAREAGAIGERRYQQTRTDQLGKYAQQRRDLADYRNVGGAALSQMAGGTAPGGEFNTQFGMDQFQRDPGAQFRLEQGEQGINRAATASGARYSGATLKALNRFNSNQASQEFNSAFSRNATDLNNRFGRLSSLAGIGQSATNQTVNAADNTYSHIGASGQNAAAGSASAASNAAAARASGYVGVGNAINGTIGGATNSFQQGQLLSGMSGSSPGYGAGSPYMGYDAKANGGWGIE